MDKNLMNLNMLERGLYENKIRKDSIGYSAGVYRGYAEEKQDGPNRLLLSIFSPSEYPNVMFPDFIPNNTLMKTVLVSQTHVVTSSYGGMLVWTPHSRRKGIRLYLADPTSLLYSFYQYVNTDQDIADDYILNRLVSGSLSVINNTISAGNFNVSGSMNCISTQFCPKILSLTHDTFSSYRSSDVNMLSTVPASIGVISVAPLPSTLEFDTPEREATFSSAQAVITDLSSGISNGTLTSSDTFYFLDTDNTVTFEDNMFGWCRVRGSINLIIDADNSVTESIRAFGLLEFTTVHAAADGTRTETVTTHNTGYFYIPPVSDSYYVTIKVDHLEDFDEDITRIRIGLTMSQGYSATQNYTTHDNNITIENYSNYRSGNLQPSVLLAWKGIDAGNQLSISGVLNYEVVPDQSLTRNLKMDNVVSEATISDLVEVTQLFSIKESGPVRTLFTIPDYQYFIRNDLLSLASLPISSMGSASSLWSKIKPHLRRGIKLGLGVLSGYNPLLGSSVKDVLDLSGVSTKLGLAKTIGYAMEQAQEQTLTAPGKKKMTMAELMALSPQALHELLTTQPNLFNVSKKVAVPKVTVQHQASISTLSNSYVVPLDSGEQIFKETGYGLGMAGLSMVPGHASKQNDYQFASAAFPMLDSTGQKASMVGIALTKIPLRDAYATNSIDVKYSTRSTNLLVDTRLMDFDLNTFEKFTTATSEYGFMNSVGPKDVLYISLQNCNVDEIQGSSYELALFAAMAMTKTSGLAFTGSSRTQIGGEIPKTIGAFQAGRKIVLCSEWNTIQTEIKEMFNPDLISLVLSGAYYKALDVKTPSNVYLFVSMQPITFTKMESRSSESKTKARQLAASAQGTQISSQNIEKLSKLIDIYKDVLEPVVKRIGSKKYPDVATLKVYLKTNAAPERSKLAALGAIFDVDSATRGRFFKRPVGQSVFTPDYKEIDLKTAEPVAQSQQSTVTVTEQEGEIPSQDVFS